MRTLPIRNAFLASCGLDTCPIGGITTLFCDVDCARCRMLREFVLTRLATSLTRLARAIRHPVLTCDRCGGKLHFQHYAGLGRVPAHHCAACGDDVVRMDSFEYRKWAKEAERV